MNALFLDVQYDDDRGVACVAGVLADPDSANALNIQGSSDYRVETCKLTHNNV